MNLDNEYEQLLKQGYIESGTLVVHVDDLTKMNLSPQSLSQSTNGERQDKSVVIVDKQGRFKKVSSLMMGYDKERVQLGDGSFVNSEELKEALSKAVSSLDSGTIIVDRKGKFLDPESLLLTAKKAAGKIIIGNKSAKITNQDSRQWSVEGPNSDKTYGKGVVFLGNKGLDLKSGDYVSADEFLKALNDYIVMVPQKIQTPTETEKKEEGKYIRVTKKYKNKLSRWLIILAATLTFTSGLKYTQKYEKSEVPQIPQEAIVEMLEKEQINYMVSELEQVPVYETTEESIKRIILDYKIGDMVETRDGDTLHYNSLLNGGSLTIGSGRKAGYYPISGISIVKDGKLLNWIEDYSIENPGKSLSDLVEETCKKYGLTYNDLEIRVHLGDSKNSTRMGWIDISDLIRSDQISKQIIDTNIKKASTYQGIVENFSNGQLTFNTLSGCVTINIKDNNGNLIKPGTTVIGSDGKEYIIESLEEKSIQNEQSNNLTNNATTSQKETNSKQLTWSIRDCNLAVGLTPLVGALAASLANKKKNEEAKANPELFEFSSDREYTKFKKDFEEAKRKYEEHSGFKKMIERVFYRKETQILQNLNSEQVHQIYSVIKNTHNGDYSYNPNDKISFKNGRIIVTYSDNRQQDITDIILPQIAHIGEKNSVITEGMIEGEKENGIHKR